jgi:hypothetical protein
MIIRKTIYLALVFLISLMSVWLVKIEIEKPLIFTICYPGLVITIQSLLRRYLFPQDRFDPYNPFGCVTEVWTESFNNYLRIVTFITIVLGMVILIYNLLRN